MFDVGFTELLILFVISLLVLGPEKLPAFAKKVGMYIRKAQSVFHDVKREVERELELEELKKRVGDNKILPKEVSDVSEQLKDVSDDLKKPLDTLSKPIKSEESDKKTDE